ncbi:MAG: DNA cytosine methyltransferase [Deltaproteobacteria bacterium]|nr:DNA cytosine methyltransferase [Deltaproteobacteria bacterium]
MKQLDPRTYEATHFALFAGAGGLSLGLTQGHARIGVARCRMRCLGGVDVWLTAMRSFERFTGSRGTVLDLFDRDDYTAFHGREPPADWREATPADLLAAAGGECPDILATSPPCKGFSGLLNAAASASDKYQALNRLTIRGLELALVAFAADPPALVLLENVPRIQTRGAELLDTITQLLRAHGYAVAPTTHDCGELGGLGQRRNRFLLVARHTRKVPPFLYQPPRRALRSIGDVLAALPLPEAPGSGPMHRLPRLTWQTWVRLALIEAGRDWRSLQDLAVVDGYLRDLALVSSGAEYHAGVLGVRPWATTAGTVTSRCGPTNGAYSVADPRAPRDLGSYQCYGVVPWADVARTVTSQAAAGAGPYSVADPRMHAERPNFNNVFRLVRWAEASQAVTAGAGPSSGGLSVADPRGLQLGSHSGKMAVQPWASAARTVTGTDRVGSGAQCVADPRPTWAKACTGDWSNSGHYGVNAWDAPGPTVTASAKLDRGSWSVADPRVLPAAHDRPDPVPLIVALDGTWHRPLTTMELAALQSYPVFDGEGRPIVFDGTSDQAWREQIGNSVPPAAARAIADEMARTLLLAELGDDFCLSATPIWVHPYVTAVSLQGAYA